MDSRFKIIILLSFLVLAGCSSEAQAPVIEGWQQPAALQSSYIVQNGDTLYSIAWAFEMDYRELAKINHLIAPYNINSGQSLRMVAVAKQRNIAAPHHAIIVPKMHYKLHWVKPAQGKIVEGFSLGARGNKGINIAGQIGDPVVAAADGLVVYSGTGLRSYGKLIIIKHDVNYLSAYAYNDSVFVHEKQSVKAGQRIAAMGQDNKGHTILHFEIRYNGKPVDPNKFLIGKLS